MSYQDLILRKLDSLKDQAKDALWAVTSCICKPAAKIKINGRTYNIIKILGEGGFSFVYLARDEASGREFALKKIRVHNSEGVKEAMREVEAYRRFRHPNIIRILDSAVMQDPGGDGKIAYLFLPLYKRGNLQDVINSNTVNSSHFAEHEMIRLFKGTCLAVQAMHDYRAVINRKSNSLGTQSTPGLAQPDSGPSGGGEEEEEDDDEPDIELPEPEGDVEGGYSYGSGASLPLVSRNKKRKSKDRGVDVLFDGDEELERLNAHAAPEIGPSDLPPGTKTELVPYAHRDIKPGNIMLSDEGEPILMDFGSTVLARIRIDTRQQALMQQDIAAEQSTMTFRAPELFDVKTGITLDEKVDIWSLGCTLYALAYNRSPFETAEQAGGSIAMAVQSGAYKHPSTTTYSQGMRDVVDACLKVDSRERPDIHKLIEMTDAVLRTLS